jgi:CelD/BcsL family acetyltransferase involved in cellulose biosynthesis
MNVAIRLDSFEDPDASRQAAGSLRLARIEIFDELAAVEPIWRRLEQENAVKTPYQSFDFVESWQRQIGTPSRVTPFIVVGFDGAGNPAFLWPLGRAYTGPVSIVSFLCGKHANFNFALWRRDFIQSITAHDLRAVMSRLGATHQVDVLSLVRQPCSWNGFPNPFALLSHQPSPSAGLRLTMTARGDEQIKQILSCSMRKQMRSKEKRLKDLPGYRYFRATTKADVERLLDAFFPLKAARMNALGIPNIFADPAHEAFVREACHLGLSMGKPLIEIHALECDTDLLAVFGAINDGRRASGMFNTYTLSENARSSPGLVLLVHLIADLAARGVQQFDLGVGEASYKTFFCKEDEPLFDSFLAVTPIGKVAAVAARASGHAKRQIKQNNVLWRLATRLRQSLAGR